MWVQDSVLRKPSSRALGFIVAVGEGGRVNCRPGPEAVNIRLIIENWSAPSEAVNIRHSSLFLSSISMTQTLVSDIDLIGNQTAAYLYDAGYVTLEDVREATAEELIDVEGVGVGKLGKLIALDRDAEVPA